MTCDLKKYFDLKWLKNPMLIFQDNPRNNPDNNRVIK